MNATWRRAIAALVMASCLEPLAAWTPSVFAEMASTLAPGVLLVANPAMNDPNFRQTVILICEHRPEGTMGLVLTRPTEILLSEALADEPVFKGTTYLLFAGGPVQTSALLMLFRTAEPPAQAKKVLDGVYLGGDLPTTSRMITTPKPGEAFRAFAGYAGWAPGQLEYEMQLGSWAPVVGTAAQIFDTDPERLWQDLLDTLRAPGTVSLPLRTFPSR
jgi:putative transcriptional regulator